MAKGLCVCDAPPVISPSLSDETVESHWDTRALLHFSAVHSWVLTWGNTHTKKSCYLLEVWGTHPKEGQR